MYRPVNADLLTYMYTVQTCECRPMDMYRPVDADLLICTLCRPVNADLDMYRPVNADLHMHTVQTCEC
jgi:hypothetical protein